MELSIHRVTKVEVEKKESSVVTWLTIKVNFKHANYEEDPTTIPMEAELTLFLEWEEGVNAELQIAAEQQLEQERQERTE